MQKIILKYFKLYEADISGSCDLRRGVTQNYKLHFPVRKLKIVGSVKLFLEKSGFVSVTHDAGRGGT